MALKITAVNPTNHEEVTTAYAKVGNFFRAGGGAIQVQVQVFHSEDMRHANANTIKEDSHYINLEDLKGDLMPAIYAVLKTFSDYAGAEDC
jgi:hypothetical protein